MADPSTSPAPEIGRLQSTFQSTPLSAHPSAWDSLWNDSYTPWDRGGPSLALSDLITSRPDLFPPSSSGRLRALVPGCGRGHDVMLLAGLGYHVVGLDFSKKAVEEARRKEAEMTAEGGEEKQGRKGQVKWVAGDFFDEGWVRDVAGEKRFDLIFDYTFFCALPPEARPKWAKRMTDLLAQSGRLVCLEWPLHKDPSVGGPPWGLSESAYLAHLARPGVGLDYGEDGRLKEQPDGAGNGTGLKQLARVKPNRTHKAGYDEEGRVIDYISVWGHQ